LLLDSNIIIYAALPEHADLRTLIATVSGIVISEAVRLRQQRKMTLGDALIGATALANGLTLVTRNVPDFDWIEGLRILDPFGST
jgi:predicted nucleic acid-binding protein